MKNLPMLILALLACVTCKAEDVQKLIQETRNLESVEGAFVGVAGTPGRFYEIAKILKGVMKATEVDKLLEDADPVVVCMGMVLLAQEPDKNAEKLRRLVDDKRKIEICPAGCVVEDSTVGGFARLLLMDKEERSYFTLERKASQKGKEAQQAGAFDGDKP